MNDEGRTVLMSEELFLEFVRLKAEAEDREPVIGWGEPYTENVTHYAPTVTLQPKEPEE